MSQASNSNIPSQNNISIRQVGFDNSRFWAYFLSTSYPCAYLEETDCEMYSLVSKVMPVDTAWSDEFTQYYDGVMDENDGYVEEPTTITAPISDSENLKIEFHPGDTIFYINNEEVGCTGPHWKLWAIPYQRVKSLLAVEHGAVLFQLLLPMAVLEEEDIIDLKNILEKHLLEFGFTQPALSQAADCIISGIVRQD